MHNRDVYLPTDQLLPPGGGQDQVQWERRQGTHPMLDGIAILSIFYINKG